MIIIDPENQVLAFHSIEWLIENEPCPKEDVENFLCDRYEKISGNKVDSESEEEQYDDDDYDLRKSLLRTVYDRFSITANGDILLTSKEGDSSSLLCVEDDARGLLKKLNQDGQLLGKMKAKSKDRVNKIDNLLRDQSTHNLL